MRPVRAWVIGVLLRERRACATRSSCRQRLLTGFSREPAALPRAESEFVRDLEAVASAQVTATRSLFMRSDCNAFAEYLYKQRAWLQKYNRRVRASN